MSGKFESYQTVWYYYICILSTETDLYHAHDVYGANNGDKGRNLPN